MNTDGMTVEELISVLEEFDRDTKVFFSFPAQDYWRTYICRAITNVDLNKLEYSDYHEAYKVVDDEFSEEDVDKMFIVLS